MQKGGGSEHKKKEKKEKQRLKKKNVKNKKTVSISTKNRLLCQLLTFNKHEGESFPSTKVNLVLNIHALQIILFGPFYVRTQYHFRSLQIVSLQLTPSVGKACVLAQVVG